MATERTSGLNVRELLELEKQIYQEQIDRAKGQLDSLRSGELVAYIAQCRPFEKERKRALDSARVHHDLNKQNGYDQLEYELQQADDVFQDERRRLRRRMLAKARRQLRHIDRRLDPSHQAKQGTRKRLDVNDTEPDKMEVEKDELEAEIQTSLAQNQKIFNLQHLVHSIPSAQRIAKEVLREVECIQKYTQEASTTKHSGRRTSRRGTPAVILQEQEQSIALGSDASRRIKAGDRVIVTSKLSEEELYGELTDVQSDGVKVTLLGGSRIHVSLKSLERKQCDLRLQPPSDVRRSFPLDSVSGNGSTRSSGVPTTSSPLIKRRRKKTTVDSRLGG